MDKETARKVARLARMTFTEDRLEVRANDIGGIIKWVEQLGEVNTDGIEPLANVVDTIPQLREDNITDGGNAKDVLSNAPEETEGYFVVPKVIEQEG